MNTDEIIAMGVAVFLSRLKDSKKKATVKKIALKVFNAIKVAFASDPDFA